VPTLPTDPALRGLLLEAIEAQQRLRAAEDEADQQRAIFRAAVARAADAEGGTIRVIAAALDVSYARVQQVLVAERRMSQPPAGGA